MLLTYLNLTPDERVDVNMPGAEGEAKGITHAVDHAIKKNPILLHEKEKRKSTLANYDEVNLLDIFGALNY